jgi:hypothetical protein
MAAHALGALPALPLHEAGKYVAGAYVVAFVVVLVYVTIMAIRLTRLERRLGELLEDESHAVPQERESSPKESTLV